MVTIQTNKDSYAQLATSFSPSKEGIGATSSPKGPSPRATWASVPIASSDFSNTGIKGKEDDATADSEATVPVKWKRMKVPLQGYYDE